ncbi:uncharacterized protein LOC124128671 [Haliotis rufescens]|uniref:uncharacterized protein LOC124128671 n=1 Tax=Haliotis rufescens TaxID=6454 RepID=UPI00201F8251|nr:uncharacterized protein LOC124128671 [Haliotis rufescens]
MYVVSENSKFAGKRYAKDGDTAVILIFDVNGYIAGLQAGREADGVMENVFFGMGVHYWYNIQKDMSCDDFFPMFLLYNNNKLDGLGWAFGTDLPSPRYEHPDSSTFEEFMDPVPECLSYQGRLSTMHIYMSNPLLNFC